MNFKKQFWNYWQNSWFYPEHLEKRSIKKAIKKNFRAIEGTLLDVGCGSKPYLKLLGNKVSKYIGIEYPPSYNAVKTSAEIFGNAVELPIKSNSIDVVLSTQVLEHLQQPHLFFMEANRVLRPGGLLYLTTNQEWGIHKAPRDFFRFTRYGVQYLSESANLECLKIENRGGFWVMIGQRLSAYVYDRWVDRFRKNFKFFFLTAFLLTAPFILAIQLLALIADKLDYIETNTIGYFLISRKPKTV